MKTVKLIDLCCGAGGCAVGYKQAADELGIEIEITGIDTRKQPNYPYPFIQGDAYQYLRDNYKSYTHFHASPPCQAFSPAGAQARKMYGTKYDAVTIHSIKSFFKDYELQAVLENVPGSPCHPDIVLVGKMFGLPIKRKRHFELFNWWMLSPGVPQYQKGCYLRGEIVSIFGNGQTITKDKSRIQLPGSTVTELWSNAMGIDWMNKRELAQAIPPAYTKYIGLHWFKQTGISNQKL